MMKAAAETAVNMQVMSGHPGARQAPRSRLGAEQLLADFEGLLARQSAAHDTPLDKTEVPAVDNRAEPAPRATPEALFMALSGGAELMVQEETAGQPQLDDDSSEDGEPAQADAPQPQAAAPRSEIPAMVIDVVKTRPSMRMETGEEPLIVKDEALSPKPGVAVSDIAPAVDAKRPDNAVVDVAQADTGDVPPRSDVDSRAVTEKRSARVAPETPAAEKTSRNQEAAAPVTLVRVAGVETHFAPSPAPIFADQKIDLLPLSPPAAPDGPGRAQPALPPVAVKMPNGPLKTLKVELGSHELGLVNATVALRDKAIDLKIGAARDDAVASLKENAGKLSDALQALGYSVDGVSVQKMQQGDAGNQTGMGQSSQQDAGGQDARGQGQQRTSGGSGFGSESSSGQSRHTHRDDHFAEQEGNDQPKGTAVGRTSRGVFL